MVIFNGEIYNSEEFSPPSLSDGHSLLAAYHKLGPSFPQHLDGEFSLVLFDYAKSLLIVASDTFGTKLLFASTTPWLCTASTDALVQKLNTEAADVMKAADIPMVDLHSTIVGKCGAAPVAECFGSKSCFCPHCPGGGNAGGYSWVVNSTIVPAIRALLKQ